MARNKKRSKPGRSRARKKVRATQVAPPVCPTLKRKAAELIARELIRFGIEQLFAAVLDGSTSSGGGLPGR